MPHKILVVDDDNALREMVGIVLESEGFEVSFHDAGSGALEAFKSQAPDLVLLDVMLPGKDGIEVCTEIREVSGTPIIMLTAKTESEDVVRGLEAGADDYVVKPFDPTVLLARIRARLRPLASASEDTVQIGPLTLDIVGHEVRRGNEKLLLTPLEFNLLLTLAVKPKQVFTREMLLETVWGYHYKADTRLVNVHVQRLRSKIEDDPDNPKIVTTVRGIGYKAGQS
jgi:two-component system response regulator MtrA